jgi:enoyl-CoA hydratase/carnithine racemase
VNRLAPSRDNCEFILSRDGAVFCLQLRSADFTNRLTKRKILALTVEIERISTLSLPVLPLIVTGNERFFSAGADLREIAALKVAAEAHEFARAGQRLMDAIDRYPALTIAAIEGFCMGGGLDLALACDVRIAAPNAVFGHRGAALGIMTGWGGTQRLPRLIGRARALQMFLTATKVHAPEALRIGLVDGIAEDPVTAAILLDTDHAASLATSE